MPYTSKAQQRWAHTSEGTQALGGAAKVKEWDAATNFKNLPARKHERRAFAPRLLARGVGR